MIKGMSGEGRRKNEDPKNEEMWCVAYKLEPTSRPRSIYGQQYPCPAFLFPPRFSDCKQGSGPRRTMSCTMQGIFVLSVSQSVQGGSGLWLWPRGPGLEDMAWKP